MEKKVLSVQDKQTRKNRRDPIRQIKNTKKSKEKLLVHKRITDRRRRRENNIHDFCFDFFSKKEPIIIR